MSRTNGSSRITASILGVSVLVAGIPMAATADPPGLLDVTTNLTLTDDWYGSVVIAAPDVTFDCAGHSIIGPGVDSGGEELPAIQVEPESGEGGRVVGVTVKNCVIVDHLSGVSVGADHTTLRNNTVDGSTRGVGGFSIFSDHNTIEGNTAFDLRFDGFLIRGSEEPVDPVVGNLLQGNHAENNSSNFSLEFANDTTLRDNVAVGGAAEGLGFQIYRSSGNLLTGNAAHDTVEGILLAEGADGNTVRNNETTNNGDCGFAIDFSSNNTLEGNVAFENSHGFCLYFGDGNRLDGNTATDNGDGFGLESSTRNVLTDNHAKGSGSWGFALFDSSENNLNRNTSHDGEVGFLIEGSSSNALNRNTAKSAAFSGFLLTNASDSSLVRNESINDDEDFGHGFRLEGSSWNHLERNASFGGDDFILDGSGHNTLTRNSATGNPDRPTLEHTDGFLVLNGSNHNTLQGNTATSSGNSGFRIEESSDNAFERNRASRNFGPGFLILSSEMNALRGDTSTRNGSDGETDGFFIMNSSDNRLVGVVADRNSGSGIAILFDSDRNRVEESRASHNAGFGIIVVESSSNSILGNIANDNDEIGIDVGGSLNVIESNRGCHNITVDARDEGTDNIWADNTFCTTEGIS